MEMVKENYPTAIVLILKNKLKTEDQAWRQTFAWAETLRARPRMKSKISFLADELNLKIHGESIS